MVREIKCPSLIIIERYLELKRKGKGDKFEEDGFTSAHIETCPSCVVAMMSIKPAESKKKKKGK